MKVNVKICGIRSVETALAAVAAGADFIGLNFVPTSKRKITEDVAREIIATVKDKAVPAGRQVKIVGVFQNAELNYVNETADELGLDFVQLHGAENASYIEQIHTNVIRGIPLAETDKAEDVIQKMQLFPVSFFLLDREVQGKGSAVNTETAKELAATFELFLAGGLTPENVAELVRAVKPFAVDVAGGIETDGKEDIEKIRRFIINAKG